MKKVSVVMGSTSDWPIMKEACVLLEKLGIDYSRDVVSAHRTPKHLYDFASNAKTHGRQIIIAGAGGAAHLPGMIASLTPLPVIGVPIKTSKLNGLDSMLSIVQMPPGIPVGTMAINGAKNAALYAASIIALNDESVAKSLQAYREAQTDHVMNNRKLTI